MIPGPMVGRGDELAELTRRWNAVTTATRAAPRTVVVTGGPGLGKSRLVAEALGYFTPAPAVTLFGTARMHSPAPYDWLAGVLGGHELPELLIPADALAWLVQEPHASERYAPEALLRLAVRVVRALAGTGPAVLVVEDLHALDPASVNLVCELAVSARLRAMLLVTSRPPESAVAPGLVADAIARLSGTPGAMRQHLAPLGPAEVADVVAAAHPRSPVPAQVSAAVFERTGGNPYWITELLAANAGAGPAALLDAPLPAHLRLGAGAGPQQAGPADRELLTDRELQVLSCLVAGQSNKQVAKSLGISIRTVAVHVSNLLRKTGSASRTEAAMWAVRRG